MNAIDLVDEECALIKTELDSMPTELDELQRRIMQMEIEEAALKKETDKLSQDRLEALQRELAEQRDVFNARKAQWDNEKHSVENLSKLREQIENMNKEIEKAQRNYDLNRAAELQYGELPKLQQQLAIEEEKVKSQDLSLVHESVTDEEIARIISRWTGIPVAKLTEGERSKILHLDDELHRRVGGQDDGVTKVTEAILRSKAGIKDPTKPIGSFLFLGPTGVGKTELAKALAASLFDDEQNMVRIDMSEYMEKYSVSRLIGAPPGYVGYEEGGTLTNLEGIGEDGEIDEGAEKLVMEDLRNHFRPEFLNRLDETIMFKPLTKANIGIIVDLMMKDLNKRLAAQEISLELTETAKAYMIEGGYDPAYGARPLKRFLQKHVETLAARLILSGEVRADYTVLIDILNGRPAAVRK